MKLIQSIILYIFLSAVSQIVYAHSNTISMVIIGEDSDKNAIKRSSEVYKRVVTELQQSLIDNKIYVIDEDMISARLGFKYSENRDKQDLIKALSIANSTNDARVRSRFGVIFAIFPNIQEMSITRKISVRLRGQIFDLRNQRALSSFEVKSQKFISIPKDNSICNDLCIEEKIGDLSIALSSNLGKTLIEKFNDLIAKEVAETGSSKKDISKEILVNTYTIGFKNISKEKIKKAIELIEDDSSIEIELLNAKEKERAYSIRAKNTLMEIEAIVLKALKRNGIDEKNVIVRAQD
jgi:hypothetical protein